MSMNNPAEQFAVITETLREGRRPLLDANSEENVAARLLTTTPDALPDPYFVESLRAELLARVRRGDAIRYAPLDTPAGRIFVAYREGMVVSTGGAWQDASSFERTLAATLGQPAVAEEAPPEPLRRAVIDHLEGRGRVVQVDLSWLRPFQRRVLEKTAEIPRGEVRPYAWVAHEIGAPGASRAVGTALGHNPIPFIVPCHRVVRADGRLGEYSGGGPDAKTRWLTWEGVAVDTAAGRVRLTA